MYVVGRKAERTLIVRRIYRGRRRLSNGPPAKPGSDPPAVDELRAQRLERRRGELDGDEIVVHAGEEHDRAGVGDEPAERVVLLRAEWPAAPRG